MSSEGILTKAAAERMLPTATGDNVLTINACGTTGTLVDLTSKFKAGEQAIYVTLQAQGSNVYIRAASSGATVSSVTSTTGLKLATDLIQDFAVAIANPKIDFVGDAAGSKLAYAKSQLAHGVESR